MFGDALGFSQLPVPTPDASTGSSCSLDYKGNLQRALLLFALVLLRLADFVLVTRTNVGKAVIQ